MTKTMEPMNVTIVTTNVPLVLTMKNVQSVPQTETMIHQLAHANPDNT